MNDDQIKNTIREIETRNYREMVRGNQTERFADNVMLSVQTQMNESLLATQRDQANKQNYLKFNKRRGRK